MNDTVIIFLAPQLKVRSMKCQYVDDGSTYFFKTTDANIKTGDFVVVPEVKAARTGTSERFTTCKVTEADAYFDFNNTNMRLNWIVQRVDRTAYDKVREIEQTVIRSVQAKRFEKAQQEFASDLGLALDVPEDFLLTSETDVKKTD